MAVQPVEYKHKSSTEGFADVGDKKNINSADANIIYKDEKQGFVDLDKAQETYLGNFVETDKVTYSKEENNNIGKTQIDTSNTGKTNGWNATGTSAGTVVGGVVGSLAVKAGASKIGSEVSTQVASKVATETAAKSGAEAAKEGASEAAKATAASDSKAAQAAQAKATEAAKHPFAPVIAGGISLATSLLSLQSANKFDDKYNDRMNANGSAETTNSTMQNAVDQMTGDQEAMGQESADYENMASDSQANALVAVGQKAALQIQYQQLVAQGDNQGAQNILKQIQDLEKSQAEDPNKDKMQACKDNIAQYQQNSEVASGVADSGQSVSDFLKDGKTMGLVGRIMAGIDAIIMVITAAGAIKSIASIVKAPTLLKGLAGICAAAGAALFVASTAVMTTATLKINSKASDEYKCADAGDNMQTNIDNLRAGITTQSSSTDATSTGYVATDTKDAAVLQKTKENADKGVAKATGKPTPDKPGEDGKPGDGGKSGDGKSGNA